MLSNPKIDDRGSIVGVKFGYLFDFCLIGLLLLLLLFFLLFETSACFFPIEDENIWFCFTSMRP